MPPGHNGLKRIEESSQTLILSLSRQIVLRGAQEARGGAVKVKEADGYVAWLASFAPLDEKATFGVTKVAGAVLPVCRKLDKQTLTADTPSIADVQACSWICSVSPLW